jgi:flagellar hook-basal body complex protein FliE
MTTIKAHFDGKTIVPDEPADLPIGQPLTVHVEQTQTGSAQTNEKDFEKLLAQMDRDASNSQHPVDDSRDSIYSGTIDDPR